MRQVIRLPEPKVRPEVARRMASADILRPYDVVNWLRVPPDPTVDILTAAGPTDPPPPR